MKLVVYETVQNQYGVDADTDAEAIKAVHDNTAEALPGTKSVSYRVQARPEPPKNQSGVSPALAASGKHSSAQ